MHQAADLPRGKTGKANWSLNHIHKLYRIEIKGNTPAEKHQIRQAEALPLLNLFEAWLDKSGYQIPPETALGTALSYSLNQRPKLIRYIEDGNLSIGNNRAERAIKSFVKGRKKSACSASKWCKRQRHALQQHRNRHTNGLAPFDYLNYLQNVISVLQVGDNIDHLLPWIVAKK